MFSICLSISFLPLGLGGAPRHLLPGLFSVFCGLNRCECQQESRERRKSGALNPPAHSGWGGHHSCGTALSVQLPLPPASSDFPFLLFPQAQGLTGYFQPRILHSPIYPVDTSVSSPFIKLLSSHPTQLYHLFLPGTLDDRDLVEMRERAPWDSRAGRATEGISGSKALRWELAWYAQGATGATRVGVPEQ